MCSPFIWFCCLFERFQRTKLGWQRRQVMDVPYLWLGNMNCRDFSVIVCLCSYNSLFWRPRKLNSWAVISDLLFSYVISGVLLHYLFWDPELSEIRCIFFLALSLFDDGKMVVCTLSVIVQIPGMLSCCGVVVVLFQVIVIGLFLNNFL